MIGIVTVAALFAPISLPPRDALEAFRRLELFEAFGPGLPPLLLLSLPLPHANLNPPSPLKTLDILPGAVPGPLNIPPVRLSSFANLPYDLLAVRFRATLPTPLHPLRSVAPLVCSLSTCRPKTVAPLPILLRAHALPNNILVLSTFRRSVLKSLPAHFLEETVPVAPTILPSLDTLIAIPRRPLSVVLILVVPLPTLDA